MILVFGSINADLFFALDNLPRPGETVLTGSYSFRPGGKGANQAVAAARDGAEVRLAGAVGTDAHAAPCLAALETAGVDIAPVRAVDGVTGTAMVALDARGENQIIVASGANMQASADDLADRAVLAPGATLLVQMELPPAEITAAIHRGRARGCRVILNTAPARPLPAETLANVDILIANEEEAANLLKHTGYNTGPDGAALAHGLARLCGARLYGAADTGGNEAGIGIVTLGAAGACIARAGEYFQLPALPVQPVDTVGAGDIFCGTLAAALDRGLPLTDAARRASAAAGLACTLPGAQPPDLNAARITAALADLPPVIERRFHPRG